jgi:hypothetical protein
MANPVNVATMEDKIKPNDGSSFCIAAIYLFIALFGWLIFIVFRHVHAPHKF